jgi:cell shape-determining protein MreD
VTRARVAAALAALITALLLQGTLVAPLTMSVPVSLPAVLVAAVALVNGPASGMSFGFTVGLIADLGSGHPAGVLALSWLGLGVVCGLAADRRTVRGDAALAAGCCAVAAMFATLLLTVVHAGGATAWLAVRGAVPAGLGDALLALAVVPLVRSFLGTDRLRAPRVLASELGLGSPRG